MSDASATTSCGTFSYGETEDYTVNFTSSKTSRESGSAADNTGIVYSSETKQIPNEPIVSKKNFTVTKDVALSVYPNPTSNNAEIKFNLSTAGNAKIRLIDLMGQTIIEQDLGFMNEGENTYTLTNLSDVSKGSYLLLLDVDGKILSNKSMSIIK